MAPPTSRLRWTPGETGQPEPPTVHDLSAWLKNETGRVGLSFEKGKPWEHGETYAVVMRIIPGRPIGLLVMRMYEGTPGLVDFAVEHRFRRLGIARGMAVEAKRHGIDLRETGAIWDGPLTAEGQALRDSLVAWAHGVYGPASWQGNGNGH